VLPPTFPAHSFLLPSQTTNSLFKTRLCCNICSAGSGANPAHARLQPYPTSANEKNKRGEREKHRPNKDEGRLDGERLSMIGVLIVITFRSGANKITRVDKGWLYNAE